ncbi:hypothetical protein Tco_0635449 [Tanacetum coccineum]
MICPLRIGKSTLWKRRQMTARKIFDDCMMENFQDESNDLENENIADSQEEEAGSINDKNLNNHFYLEGFNDGEKQKMRELIKDRVHDEWYIRTSDDDDDLEYLEDYLEITSSGGFVDTMKEY